MRFRKFRSNAEMPSKWLPINFSRYINVIDSIAVHRIENLNSIENLIFENETKKNIVFFSEGLIKTYPTGKFIKVFKGLADDIIPNQLKHLKFSDIQSWSKKDDSVVYMCMDKTAENNGISAMISFVLPVFKKQLTQTIEKIKDISDSTRIFGYSLTSIDKLQNDMRNDIEALVIQFEAKYPSEKFKLADVLLHVAPFKYFEKIKKHGLVPKAKSAEYKYNPRIYLFNQCSEKLALQYGQYKAKSENDAGFCVFKIQKEKLVNSSQWKNGKLSFYIDNSFDTNNSIEALFTYDNINLNLIDSTCLKYKLDDLNNPQVIKFK